ncbi:MULTISPECIES: gliding motility-associated ABC transporter permease subunit GldF [Emticicia]|uniref:gliding motility-associated ABC transporter permease subunit GldF n=1 Tax=Emticicia TaxID=312278 RepID=UPI0007D89FE2|nr:MULTISPECIES: gliding motility-associated ABC transporter permease subunit GldF [Emticicia]
MLSILKKELYSFLNSLVAYIVIGVFLVIVGLFTWFFDSNVLDYGYADLNNFFQLTPFIFIFLIPAITMRSLSEEYKTGTIELLFTKPLSEWQIIIGKFLASFLLIAIALLPTLLYYYSIYQLGSPKGNIDSAAVSGSYLGLLLLGATFASIGLWSSSITDNQIIAFIIGALFCYIIYDGIQQLANVFTGTTQYFINFLSLSYHYDALGRGLIDSKNIIYLLSIIFLMLYLSKQNISLKKN